ISRHRLSHSRSMAPRMRMVVSICRTNMQRGRNSIITALNSLTFPTFFTTEYKSLNARVLTLRASRKSKRSSRKLKVGPKKSIAS
ncbi:MAG: hypothetical protein Q9174_005842, partial [Haloplaca sp. 1 TL-2023]